MQTIALTIFSLTLIGAAVAGAEINTDNYMLELLAKSNALSSSVDAALATACFTHHLPILQQTSGNFSTTYRQCVATANKATAVLNANATAKQIAIQNHSTIICNALDACNSVYDEYLDFFNCFASAASNDVSKIYSLSAVSFSAAITLNSGLQKIKKAEDLCIAEAKSHYETQSTEISDELSACFVYGLPVNIIK